MSEALIFGSTNLQDDDIELQVQYVHENSKLKPGEDMLCTEQFLYTTCSPHVLQKEELLKKVYLYQIRVIFRRRKNELR